MKADSKTALKFKFSSNHAGNAHVMKADTILDVPKVLIFVLLVRTGTINGFYY